MIYKRKITNQILERLNSIPVVVILGSRQVGKTTLAMQIRKELIKDSIYLDLESDEDLNKLTNAELYFNERNDKLIIIDEIQRKPELFPLLRSVIDKKRTNGRFLLLGSASPELLVQSSESLAGRVSFFDLTPFLYTEINEIADTNTLWLRGGYPDMLLAKNDLVSHQNRVDFIKTYIERDLPLVGLNISSITMNNLLKMIGHLHGGILNYSVLSRSLGISMPTIKKYIDFLEHSYLIKRLQPYYTNISKRLIKSPKIYYLDSGIFHSISGIKTKEELDGFHLRGNSWEGFVIQQITGNLRSDISTYYYRTQDGSELDLILAEGNKTLLGIEIKLTNAPVLSKGNSISAKDLNNLEQWIITPSVSEDYKIDSDCTVMSFTSALINLQNRGYFHW